jgi:hypothetical protein
MDLWVAYAENKWKQQWEIRVAAYEAEDAREGLSSLLFEEEILSEENDPFDESEWEIHVEEKPIELEEGLLEMLEEDGYVVL